MSEAYIDGTAGTQAQKSGIKTKNGSLPEGREIWLKSFHAQKLNDSDLDPKRMKTGNSVKKILSKMEGINMSVANKLFKETNALAEKLGKKNSGKINLPPQRKKKDVKPELPEKHRYGPEDRPPPLSKLLQEDREKVSMAEEITPLAFCPVCKADVPMKWKPREKCGKTVDEWFTCATCGCGQLEIKRLTRET